MGENKLVFFFGNGNAEGSAEMKDLLGGKGAHLAEMTRIGVPVPAGFTISTEVCNTFFENDRQFPPHLAWRVDAALGQVEKTMGTHFGDPDNPLLVSVRSGGRASMPGMMDTVLNLGLNDRTIQGLIKQSRDPRFAYDCYRRFIQMYANVVMGVEHHPFEQLIRRKKRAIGKTHDTELSAEDWRELVAAFKERVRQKTGKTFPEDPQQQLWEAIGAVFNSWWNPRAATFRRHNNIPGDWGTAVNVQSMVFGNMGDDCATGVAFTRDPSSGDSRLFGEYLINAQGEDVVAGIRTPCQITNDGRDRHSSNQPAMEETMPVLYAQLVTIANQLENHYRDMQDLEFTIQQGKLWLLQTRSGKRSAQAAVTMAVAMVHEKLITREEAISRVEAESLKQLLHPMLDDTAREKMTPLAQGLAASPGAACGQVAFTPEETEQGSLDGNPIILVREETSPEDINGMLAAKGIVTARGGMTSHAAVVARGMGRPCVSGCADIHIDIEAGHFSVGNQVIKRGDWITIDGGTGELFRGQVPTKEPKPSADFATFMSWADKFRRMKVRTNADTPGDAHIARQFGADGIGLCRTEHMFFEDDRILSMREMILARDEKGRRRALDKILPMQRSDFEGIFREMKGFPVTIRLLDPPLHEFIPRDKKGQQEVAEALGVPLNEVVQRVQDISEVNPMLGHRGCRLGITHPEIYEMQVRAIIEAACTLVKREGFAIIPEIMIPLVAKRTEFAYIKERCTKVCKTVMKETGVKLEYTIGTMIELPRAAMTADRIAQDAEFFSFGTNDLTQTAMGLSRDDAGGFLTTYMEKGLLQKDPFVTLDQPGVGRLVEIGAARGRTTRPDIKMGICGEHGGDPDSINFFEQIRLDYVSCSPYRVPIARLATAQAAINWRRKHAEAGMQTRGFLKTNR